MTHHPATLAPLFADPKAAGFALASALEAYQDTKNILVLALPRGGVPVAYEIATHLHLPLDVFLVRKLGVPGHEELAMGAIAAGGVCILNEALIDHLHISKADVESVKATEKTELARRNKVYRQGHSFPNLNDKTVILVDDGIATGATMQVAITALKQLHTKRLVLAVPVAAADTMATLSKQVDKVVCLANPTPFYAVGAWYQQFSQISDDEVLKLLQQADTYYAENVYL